MVEPEDILKVPQSPPTPRPHFTPLLANRSAEPFTQESDNITANIIHDALYSSSPEIGAVVHVHSPAAKAVSCLEEGFIYLNQEVGR